MSGGKQQKQTRLSPLMGGQYEYEKAGENIRKQRQGSPGA